MAEIDKPLPNVNQFKNLQEEINWLNNYHNNVYKSISSKLDKQNKDWLKKVCAPYLKR